MIEKHLKKPLANYIINIFMDNPDTQGNNKQKFDTYYTLNGTTFITKL